MRNAAKIITVAVPTRIDLAGGTLDIPPLFLWHWPAPVINAAISIMVSVRIKHSRSFVIISRDQGISATFRNWESLKVAGHKKLELLIRLARYFPVKANISIEVDSEAPAGSGLGASSAIAVALAAALARWTSRRLSRAEIIEYAKSAETQTIKVPTGYQDYWAASYGGMKAYETGLNGRLKQASIGSKTFLKEFEEHLLLVYTGKPHFSGANNWELFKRRVDGDKDMVAFFSALQKSAHQMRKAVAGGHIKQVAEALNDDWAIRKSMLPSMTTPAIERLSRTAFRGGALGFRVCGAGGGGCALILVPPNKRAGLKKEIEKNDMRILPAKIVGKSIIFR